MDKNITLDYSDIINPIEQLRTELKISEKESLKLDIIQP